MAAGQGLQHVSQPSAENPPSPGNAVHLESLYYDSKGEKALRGPKPLYERARALGLNLSLAEVKQWLRTQPVYTRFRPARKSYPRNPIVAYYPGNIVQIDIMDLQNVLPENDGYKYVLLTYDTYSKFTTCWPLKDRKPASVLEALENLVLTSPFQVVKIYWDKEGSFLSKAVQDWLSERGISNYTTTSIVKAPGVERVIRTLRLWLARHFKATSSWRWVDILPHLVSDYNNRIHSTTKRPPLDLVVDPTLLPENIKGPSQSARSRKLPPVDSHVRLNQNRGIFGKESRGTWTDEVFKVARHKTHMPIPMAVVRDMRGEEIRGSFYPWELQEIEWDEGKRPLQVFKTKTRQKKKEWLVSFQGYPPDFLEWVKVDPQL